MNRFFQKPNQLLSYMCKRSKTVMSGIQPTGFPHIGNYFGAIQQWITLQSNMNINRIYLSIVDLHALTPHNKSSDITDDVYKISASLIASGLSNDKVILFQQSKVQYHTILGWILMCTCPLSRIQCLPQWQEKLDNWPGTELPNTGLLMYPILQAADILLYTPDLVPVGEDQIIHLNLARYLRSKLIQWNSLKADHLEKYLPIPEIMQCQFPKIFSLKKAGKKMSKSDPGPDSRIELFDSSDCIKSKIQKSLTDSISKQITYDVESRPALANLINIYCGLKGLSPELAIMKIGNLSKSQFKDILIDELVSVIEPIRRKTEYLLNNRTEIDRILSRGNDIAKEKARQTMDVISAHVGLNNFILNYGSNSGRVDVFK